MKIMKIFIEQNMYVLLGKGITRPRHLQIMSEKLSCFLNYDRI